MKTKLIPVIQALDRLQEIEPLATEVVPVASALSRVLAEEVKIACDLPPFAQSAVDGYAVRHSDLSAPSLPISGTVSAGPLAAIPELPPGAVLRIYTGAMLPKGADTIVRQEWARVEAGQLFVTRTVALGADARKAGEELKAGTTLAVRGTRLTAGMVAALSGGGVSEVLVHAKPRITVLVTGDEVGRPGAALELGQIHDANGPLVMNWLAEKVYASVRMQYVADSSEALANALVSAFAGSDLVITTGGVSVGDHDLVPSVSQAIGAKQLFWKVAQKPGMPLFVARKGRVPLLGLPGNPASVLVNLASFGRRLLDRLEGVAPLGPSYKMGILEAPVAVPSDRDLWLRVSVHYDERGHARLTPLQKQSSHMLSNLMLANGLALVPAASAEIVGGSVLRWIAL